MGSRLSIDYFTSELERPNGKLRVAREKLNLPSGQKLEFVHLGFGKKPDPLIKAYRVTERPRTDVEQGQAAIADFVVKFNPTGRKDDYLHNVHKEYDTLVLLHDNKKKVPKPIHCSTPEEEDAVGTQFIIMSYVEGSVFDSVGDVPADKRELALVSMMETMADIHSVHWFPEMNRNLKSEHKTTQSFWEEELTTWKNNYRRTIWWWQWIRGSFPESYLFSDMLTAGKLTGDRVSCIHRNPTISNFIFDDNMKVKAVVNFKYARNGDPLVDVASLLMVFLKPGSRAMCAPVRLLVSDPNGDMERRAYTAYHRQTSHRFTKQDLNYAKAVCCLREIYRFKNAINSGFKDTELGHHGSSRTRAEVAIETLHQSGKEFFRQSAVE